MQTRQIRRDQVAAFLGITDRQLVLLNAGQAFVPDETLINIASRLDVPARTVQRAYEQARMDGDGRPLPFDLRELERQVNDLRDKHRHDAANFLAQQGVTVGFDVPERRLETWLAEKYLADHWFDWPRVGGVDTFRIKGMQVHVAPPAEAAQEH